MLKMNVTCLTLAVILSGITSSVAIAQEVCPTSRIKQISEARQYFKYVIEKEIIELSSDFDRTADKDVRMAITEEKIKLLKLKANIMMSMTKRELLVGGCGD